ncbi:MAG: hypothetical protein Q9216_000410 [Gyalolechia sp. 2 TL-2023]
MALLRLQVVVQPRALPSPSGPTLSEPTIKWLEICPDHFTIQELSERLEKRFFDRNHAPLNIKILKYLDDLELFPDYLLRDIFEDINNTQAGDKSYSTVKVYRNPPSTAEQLDPRRFDSLPPNSLARPVKRPLPPCFAEATRNVIHDPINYGPSRRGCSPPHFQSRNKRRKVGASDFQLYTDSDRPINSLEDQHDLSTRTAPQPPSAIRQIEDSQKKKRSSLEPLKPTVHAKNDEGSDPYGTPISSQVKLHDFQKPLRNAVIYIPDSPSSEADASAYELLRQPISHGLRKSRSPEIPMSNAPSSMSQEIHPGVPLPNPLPQSNQQHQEQVTEKENSLGTSPETSKLATPVSQEPAVALSKEAAVDSGTKTPSPKQKDSITQPGRLRRPKSFKRLPKSKPTRKLINGVRQTAPSVYDPIETSEGSTHERELLRSAKRSKTSAPPNEDPKSKTVQEVSISTSSGARSLGPDANQSEAVSPPSPDSSIPCAPLKSVQNLETVPVEASSATALTAAPSVEGAKQSEKPWSLDVVSNPERNNANTEQDGRSIDITENTAVAVPKPCGLSVSLNQASVSIAGDNDGSKSLKRQLLEAEENKRKAQAEFDRIAALQIEQRQIDQRRNEGAFGDFEDASINLQSNRDPASSAQAAPNGSQQPLKAMSVEERRQYNLKHVTPGLNKQLSGMIEKKANELQDEKDKEAAIQKQERTAQLEAHRQARLVRTQEVKDQKIAAKEQAREDQVTSQQQSQARETKNKQKRFDDQTEHDELSKVAQRKTKLKQGRQPNEEAAESAKPPVRKRIAKKINPPQEGVQDTLPKKSTAKVKVAEKSDHTLHNGSLLEAQSQIKIGRTESDGAAAKANDGDRIDSKKRQSAPQQVVGEHNLDWLVQRSPKAIYNAQRQLQLANKLLKHKERDSTGVTISGRAPKLTSNDTNSAPPPKARLLADKTAKKKQHHEALKQDQQRKAKNQTFTDSEALRAAGIFAHSPKATAAPKDASSSISAPNVFESTSYAPPSSGLSGQPRSLGLLKVLESQSSSPAPERSSQSMTPAYPGSSARSNRVSTEAQNSTATPAAFAKAKTPIRSALRVTSGASGHSVSFAHGSDPSSQSQDVSSKPSTYVSETKKGMLHRALQESNAKKAGVTNEKLKSASSGLSAGNKVQKPVKQTKLTQHVSRDSLVKDKGKGRAIRSPTPELGKPISITSSVSEAETYFSDEAEDERNARAGPSLRKKLPPILRVEKTKTGIQPIGSTSRSQSSVQHERRSSATRKEPKSTTAPASSGKRTGQGLSQSTSYSNLNSDSGSGSGSVSERTDDPSLLPSINPRKQAIPASSQQSQQSQRSALTKLTSSRSGPRLSSSLAPMSPKDGTEDARIAKMRNERMQSEEADRQLQRELDEARKRQRDVSEELAKQENLRNAAASDKSAPTSAKQENSNKGAASNKSALSALRKAQVAAEPVKVQEATKAVSKIHSSPPTEASGSSDSDESSSSSSSGNRADTSQESQETGLAGASSQGSRFVKFAKEVFWRK